MSEKLRLQEPIRSPLETPRLITPLPYRSGTSFLAWAIVNNNQPVPDVFSKMTKIAASGRLGRIGVDRCISQVGSFQWFTRIPAESGISAGNRTVWDAGCLLAVTRTYDEASSDRATHQIISASRNRITSDQNMWGEWTIHTWSEMG